MSNAEMNEWPGSVIDRAMIAKSVGRFLRTHRDGKNLLLEWLDSRPADRSEMEYAEERARVRQEHEIRVDGALERINAQREMGGLPPLDRDGNVMR